MDPLGSKIISLTCKASPLSDDTVRSTGATILFVDNCLIGARIDRQFVRRYDAVCCTD